MPTLHSGKINKQALKEIYQHRQEALPVRQQPKNDLNAIETHVLSTINQLTNQKISDVDTNFFELGMTSLMLSEMLVNLNDHFSISLSKVAPYRFSTIKRFSKRIMDLTFEDADAA